jgi:hypothetical protein
MDRGVGRTPCDGERPFDLYQAMIADDSLPVRERRDLPLVQPAAIPIGDEHRFIAKHLAPWAQDCGNASASFRRERRADDSADASHRALSPLALVERWPGLDSRGPMIEVVGGLYAR